MSPTNARAACGISEPTRPLRSVAAIGDSGDIATWSGIPYHFVVAARAAGFADTPWRLDLERLRTSRLLWNAGQLLRGRGAGGFQYSDAFLRAACAQIPQELFASEVISFHPHFPPAERIRPAGGKLNHYIDAPFAALSSGRALSLSLPKKVIADARRAERENFAFSERIITMARWAAESVVSDCEVTPEKVTTVLPGANLLHVGDLPAPPQERAGRERDFTLGFVGMDWQRKGLPFLIDVRDGLARRGWRAIVKAAGEAPPQLSSRVGVQFVGRIDKARKGGGFAAFLQSCDVGCLFSTNEALGLSTLEFLRAGVPVAGFADQGLADTLPPDAGFRFQQGRAAAEVADAFESYLKDEQQQVTLRQNAQDWAPKMTWERCVGELQELWETGEIRTPVRPWLGLQAHGIKSETQVRTD